MCGRSCDAAGWFEAVCTCCKGTGKAHWEHAQTHRVETVLCVFVCFVILQGLSGLPEAVESVATLLVQKLESLGPAEVKAFEGETMQDELLRCAGPAGLGWASVVGCAVLVLCCGALCFDEGGRGYAPAACTPCTYRTPPVFWFCPSSMVCFCCDCHHSAKDATYTFVKLAHLHF
jgi:hypothetical protein